MFSSAACAGVGSGPDRGLGLSNQRLVRVQNGPRLFRRHAVDVDHRGKSSPLRTVGQSGCASWRALAERRLGRAL